MFCDMEYGFLPLAGMWIKHLYKNSETSFEK